MTVTMIIQEITKKYIYILALLAKNHGLALSGGISWPPDDGSIVLNIYDDGKVILISNIVLLR